MPKNTIKFGKVVSAIYWEQSLSKVKVICEDEEYVADHTIVTCSLGYLKLHHNKLFKPPLPQNKMDAIENMGFGKVNKIFLYFEKPFWTKGKGGVKLAWNHTSNSFEESQWYTSIFAFDEVLNNPKVLVAWVHGKAAEYMETLPENTIIKTCAFLLQSFLKDDTIPAPTKVKRSTWCSYPYTAGSYSYFGVQSLSSDVKSLAEPLVLERRPIVCFAGEATSEQYFSTTHGARSSGIREAERLINYYDPHSML
jgi:monoamine oxidase